MKLLLLLLATAPATACLAQNYKYSIPQRQDEWSRSNKFSLPLQPGTFQLTPGRNFSVRKTIGSAPVASTGVYSLPADNMPCLVPDTRSIAPIPNAVSDVQVPYRTSMPNAFVNPGTSSKF